MFSFVFVTSDDCLPGLLVILVEWHVNSLSCLWRQTRITKRIYIKAAFWSSLTLKHIMSAFTHSCTGATDVFANEPMAHVQTTVLHTTCLPNSQEIVLSQDNKADKIPDSLACAVCNLHVLQVLKDWSELNCCCAPSYDIMFCHLRISIPAFQRWHSPVASHFQLLKHCSQPKNGVSQSRV